MPQTPHLERHFLASNTVRDIVIGMADGLTVPFALAAGLSGAIASTKIVTTAGLAEIAAGAIAMGLGGYLAARSDAEHYATEWRREQREIVDVPEREVGEIEALFKEYGVSAAECGNVVAALRRNPEAWTRFMMRFELGLEMPAPGRALRSALTIAAAYVAGGLIPLMPYFHHTSVEAALPVSIGATLVALATFGFVKGRYTGVSRLRSALETLGVGSAAAAAAFAIARALA
ncbi:MAG: VIT1/CCC1 transporter family protein [Gammaproteobacteria bacterium]